MQSRKRNIKLSHLIIVFALATAACVSPVAGSAPDRVPVAAASPPGRGEPELASLWEALSKEMERHRLKGLSVAVFDDYRIVEHRTFGVRSAEANAPISAQTAFSTVSISKPVTALVCAMLAAEGVIDLDAPIANYLKSWRLPESAHRGAAEVTWRQLLTHTAGTSQHGFADYYEGDRLPTLIDSLEGRLPRYDKPIEFLFPPGTGWRYSGGGYVIVQLALEDHTGIPLAELAARRVFQPLGMHHTTMIQPGAAGFPADAALVHAEDGTVIRTGLPITPQVSASGMWSTPADLARFAIAIQRALAGDGSGPIAPATARALTDVFSLEHVGGMGMPFFRGFGFGNTDWFRHDGSNTGVNGDLMASMEGGYGIAVLANGDDANTGPVFATLRREIIDGMKWNERHKFATAPLPEDLKRTVLGTYTGLLYDLGLEYRIEEQDDALWIGSEFFTQFLGRERSRMHHLGGGTFAIEDYPNLLRFDCTEGPDDCNVTVSRPVSDAAPVVRAVGDTKAAAPG